MEQNKYSNQILSAYLSNTLAPSTTAMLSVYFMRAATRKIVQQTSETNNNG